ncbi:unnamed protein product [Paramecium primaurelia]|uniref:Uncharacterized protein n=1 Tax=Paramecium primaurelia TaxID=5886 RepID=A0A8S1NUM1_PARPR|nr:unnamed protein product [Paramecium primaurelia]
MKPTAKVFEFLNSYNYYLPQNCEQVQKMFYEQMVKHLQLGDSFKNSFISQISQINQKAQRETEFRQLIRDTWLGFIENTPINNICQMLNSQEIKDVQDFILKVLLEPKRFDITYVDELLMNYESYFNSNKGLAQVVVRNRFRMTVSKLICSKFILSLDEIYQQKVRQFLFDIYLKKIEKLEQPVVIQTEFLTDSNFYFKMFEQLFDTQQDVQGTFYNLIKNVITIIVRDMSNIVFSLGIFQQFYQLYIEKDKILFEKYDQRSNVDQNKLANEILQKYKEREDLRDAIRQVVHKIFQTQNIEYKKLLKELVSKDIYNRENEQWVCQILREFDQQQRYRKPPCENDFHIYLRLQGFTLKGDKRGESEYDHPKLTLIIHDQNNTNFTVHNKLTKQTKRFDQTKEVHHYIQSSLQNYYN